jgi:hypothetical protein
MAITTYSETLTAALAGQLAGLNHDIRSFTNEEATEDLPFGRAVVQGTGARGALLPSTSDDIVVGIIVHGHSYGADDLGDLGPLPLQSVDVLNHGQCWVEVAGSVSIGDRGYVHYAGDQLGRIGGEDISDTTFDTAAQIRFLTAATTAGDLALVEVDFNAEQGASTVSA